MIIQNLEHTEDISAFVHGELRLDKISQKDKDDLMKFSQKTGIEIKDMGEFKIKEVIELSSIIEEKIKKPHKKMNDKDLLAEIHEFISSHNTLALSTGYGEYVRCTPVEYTYYNESIYIITEGGMKFKGIIQNIKV